MRDRPRADTPAHIDSFELAAILEEVRRAVLAVDAGTGEHHPLRTITLHAGAETETVAER